MSLFQFFSTFFLQTRFPNNGEYIEIIESSKPYLVGFKGFVTRSKSGYLNLLDNNRLIVITLKKTNISFKDNTGKIYKLDKS